MAERATLTPGLIQLLIGAGDPALDSDAQTAPVGSVFVKRDGPSGSTFFQKYSTAPQWRPNNTSDAFNVKAFGARGDGTTDDRPIFDTLVDPLGPLPATGAIVYFPPGTYRVGPGGSSNLIFPAYMTLLFDEGAKLKIDDGVTVVIRGDLSAGMHQVFSLANEATGTGRVRFSTAADDVGKNFRPSRISTLRPEWWGAKGDNQNDDTLSLQRCIDAAISFADSPGGIPRWPDGSVRLSSAVYKITRPIRVEGVVGFAMTGEGIQQSDIRVHGGVTGKADNGSTTSLTKAGAFAGKNYGGFWLRAYAGSGAPQAVKVTSNNDNTVSFPAVATPFDSTTYFTLGVEAALDLDGCDTGTFENFTVSTDGAGIMHTGIYYHRDPAVSARGSSKTTFNHVEVGGNFILGWKIGHLTYNVYQEDISDFHHCRAIGGYDPASPTEQYWNTAFSFGAGAWSNNLNHNMYDILAGLCKAGVVVDRTNVAIYGGTVQTCENDYYVEVGLTNYLKVSGVRSEGSRRLAYFNWAPTGGTHFSGSFTDMEVHINNLNIDPSTGTADVIRWEGAGELELARMRIMAQPRYPADGSTYAAATAGSATFVDVSGTPFAGKDYSGWEINLVDGAGRGQRAKVTSNTSSRINFEPVSNAAATGTKFEFYPVPVIRVSEQGNRTALTVSGVGIAMGRIDKVFQLGAAWATANIRGYCELDLNGTVVHHYNQVLMTPAGNYTTAELLLGEDTLQPDCRIARIDRGILGVPNLNVATMRVAALGQSPACWAQYLGTPGSTTHTYYYVAKDGVGNRAAVSSGFASAGCQAQLSKDNFVQIYPPALPHKAWQFFDIYRNGTTAAHQIAKDVPLQQLGYLIDVGQGPVSGGVNAPTVDSTGTLQVDGKVGFFGTTPQTKPVVTGSTAANSALQSLLSGLASLGLVQNNTT